MNFFAACKREALLEPVINDISELKLVYENGRYVRGPFSTLDTGSLWIWNGVEKTRRCSTWKDIYFDKYGFVSRNCYSCWKIFVRLDKITDLLKVEKLQARMGEEEDKIIGKCGPETRSYATYGGRYLAVWYAPLTKTNTLKDAFEIARRIEEELVRLGISDQVYIVRGCTEMERSFGSSNEWTYPESLHEIEDRLDKLFDLKEGDSLCPEHTNYKRKRWLEIAFISGDQSARALVENYPSDFGIKSRVNYFTEDVKIFSNWVKRGRLYDNTK